MDGNDFASEFFAKMFKPVKSRSEQTGLYEQ